MTTEVKVPDIGDFSDVPVVTILVSVGDTIAEEDPIVELESDKATMEVPSSNAGVVKEIKVSEGDTVSEGSVILISDKGARTGTLVDIMDQVQAAGVSRMAISAEQDGGG